MYPEIVFGGGTHAAWFEGASKQHRRSMKRQAMTAVESSARVLAELLEMPQYIQVRFQSDRKLGEGTYASANGSLIAFGQDCFLEYDGDGAVMRGIGAHELSHLSDALTGNNCLDGGIENELVSEGKAEVVGCDVGGGAYEDALSELAPISGEELLEVLDMPTPRARRMVTDNNGVYAVGKAMIEEVLSFRNVYIYDVHSNPSEYFLESFLRLQGYYGPSR